MYNVISIYETNIDKQEEIELLMKETAAFYKEQPGVIDVIYVKRTHRQKDSDSIKNGESPIMPLGNSGSAVYILHLITENSEIYVNALKKAEEKYNKRWNSYLTSAPKIYLGDSIELS